MKRKLLIVSRIIVAIVFIFSGFVKAVDPWGSTYKFLDYYHDAFGIQFLDFSALPLAFLLSALEFVTGIALLSNFFTKVFTWLALLFMVIFTPLTLYLAFADPVHDCGCFGDALVLSNWQTFGKNVFILGFTLLFFFLGKHRIQYFAKKTEWILLSVTLFAIFAFQYWNFSHLPILDFRAYKIGTHIPDKMIIPANAPKDEYQIFITLKDTLSNKEIEMDINQYMSDSSFWCQGTKYKVIKQTEPKLLQRGYKPPIHDLTMKDSVGNDIIQSVLADSNFNFWLITYDVNKSDLQGLIKGNQIATYCKTKGIPFYFMTASNKDDIKKVFAQIPNCVLESYLCDPITLKTIVRSHPGLVLLKKGTILNKWHFNDFPSTKELNTILNN